MGKINQLPQTLFNEIKDALESVKYGSIEIIVQNKTVTQITVRNIHKTSVEIGDESESQNTNFKNNLYIRKSAVKTR